MIRLDGRNNFEHRNVKITTDYLMHPEGSVLIEMGNTKVICTATIEEKVPPFLRGSGKGWITAEYGMLPRSTNSRMFREASKGKQSGRTMEIQRLIGRSLRAVVDLDKLGERSIMIDCDVIQADGGTRTAAITGSCIALDLALQKLIGEEKLTEKPMVCYAAAISVGIVDGEVLLDLCYEEDSTASVDMNIVMTEDGRIIEIQGTAEGAPYTKDTMDTMFDLATKGIASLITLQKGAQKELQ